MKRGSIYLLFCAFVLAGAFADAYGAFPNLILFYGIFAGLAIEWCAFKLWPDVSRRIETRPQYKQFDKYVGWFAPVIFAAIFILELVSSGLDRFIERNIILCFVAPFICATQVARFFRQRRQAAKQ